MSDENNTQLPPPEGPGASYNITQIMQMIPHRYPMLMIDRVENVYSDRSAVGIKNLTINEAFFQGHFPGHPVMPGVLMIEAMAQTSAVLVVHTMNGTSSSDKIVYFMTVDEAKFRKPVLPGDTLRMEVTKLRNRGPVWKFSGKAMVRDDLCAECVFSAMIRDK